MRPSQKRLVRRHQLALLRFLRARLTYLKITGVFKEKPFYETILDELQEAIEHVTRKYNPHLQSKKKTN